MRSRRKAGLATHHWPGSAGDFSQKNHRRQRQGHRLLPNRRKIGFRPDQAALACRHGGLGHNMTHLFPIRVYYEDTDMAGIVYHANYLKFIERARSDWVSQQGLDQNTLRERDGIVFVVRRIECDYLGMAKFDDRLEVRTVVRSVTGVRLIMGQEVFRGESCVFRAEVTAVCVTTSGQPARLPAPLRQKLH
jgi:acyl-CoA thioester hydrolase